MGNVGNLEWNDMNVYRIIVMFHRTKKYDKYSTFDTIVCYRVYINVLTFTFQHYLANSFYILRHYKSLFF